MPGSLLRGPELLLLLLLLPMLSASSSWLVFVGRQFLLEWRPWETAVLPYDVDAPSVIPAASVIISLTVTKPPM